MLLQEWCRADEEADSCNLRDDTWIISRYKIAKCKIGLDLVTQCIKRKNINSPSIITAFHRTNVNAFTRGKFFCEGFNNQHISQQSCE